MRRLLYALMVPALAFAASACQRAGDFTPAASAEAKTGGSLPNPAMSAPDQTAWDIFILAVKPSGSKGTTFETWPSDAETFSPPPPTTEAMLAHASSGLHLRPPVLPGAAGRRRLEGGGGQGAAAGGGSHAMMAGAAAGDGPPNPIPPGVAKPNDCDAAQAPATFEPGCDAAMQEEVRRNPAAHNFIVNNHLNSVSGLRKAFQAQMVVDFPTDAVEVKMNWLPVEMLATYYPGVAQDQFYIATDMVSGKKQQYALVAMHVISKQVPNWTWATFEHRANRGRCDFVGCNDLYGAVNPHVAAADNGGKTQGSVYPACAKTPALQAALKTAGVAPVFANYCLKGSQADFTDNEGLAIRVGNSITENGFVPQASCMTCHGEANVTSAGKATSVFGFFNNNGQIGAIDPILAGYWKLGGPAPSYTPYQGMPGLQRNAISADFVWSIPFCAYDDVTDPKHPKPTRCASK
ncbi:MAG: hypothetical protein QOH81_1089 [Sphingomonadales bacterium]|nr:hypothetical protein [Sphingomonadales bacterium]